MSRGQIERHLANGTWLRYAPRVYRSASHAVSERAAIIGASLWLGDAATLVGRSAARWWGLPADAPPRIQFDGPRRVCTPGTPDLDLRRTFLDPRYVTVRDGVRVISKPLAAIRAAAEMEADRVGSGLAFLDRCLQLGVRRRAIADALAHHPGARGNACARALFALTADGAESIGERRLAKLMREAKITGWEPGLWVTVDGVKYRLDFGFPELRVGIEFDGLAFHVEQPNFVGDRRRDVDLRSAKWSILHFSWEDLITRPEWVILRIRQVLTERAAELWNVSLA